jgi:Ca2+-binding RTX toxin-like protein
VPTFTGTAEAASTVTVLDGTTIIGTGVATATGTWTIASTTTLGDGKHSITVKATDTAGNASAASAAEVVTIDTSSPAAPTFSSGTLTSLSGKGESGGTVTLADGTTTVATATVGSGGNWSMSFIGGTSVRTLNATETDKAGNGGAKSGAVILGTIGNDTLVSTPGNDLLIGGAGADTYSFASLFGNDTIAGFAAAGAAHDIINFKGSSVLNSYANVMSHTTQVGTGAVISLDANDTVTLLNVNKTSLTAANFTFA